MTDDWYRRYRRFARIERKPRVVAPGATIALGRTWGVGGSASPTSDGGTGDGVSSAIVSPEEPHYIPPRVPPSVDAANMVLLGRPVPWAVPDGGFGWDPGPRISRGP